MIKVLEIYRLTFLYFIEKMLKIWESWSELGGCWLRKHKRPSRKGARAASDRKATAPRPEGAANGPAHPNGTFAETHSIVFICMFEY